MARTKRNTTVSNGDVRPPNEPSEPLKLEARRLQLRWDDEAGQYVARDEEPKLTLPAQEPYAISIARRFVPSQRQNKHDVVEEIRIHSPLIRDAVKTVMKGDRSFNWKADPLVFEPNALLAYVPALRTLLKSLSTQLERNEEMVKHVDFFVGFLSKEYRARLQEFDSLIADEQITFDWIPGLLLPGEILFTRCGLTGDPCAVKLVRVQYNCRSGAYDLSTDYVNVNSSRPGLSQRTISISGFPGTKRIRELDAYPLEYLEDLKEQQQSLIMRGKRFYEVLRPRWNHMQYNAIAFRNMSGQYRKVLVKSRIMLDLEMFGQYGPYSPPNITRDLDGEEFRKDSRTTLTDDDYLLFPARTYGYSLSDREWLEFRFADVEEIVWNPDVFDSLELDPDTKYTIRALVESQCNDTMKFDDFVIGKGRGLIFNLHGPPGVGKTLTAEATSEVTRSPLYMVGAGDLGTKAYELDDALARVSTLAYRWKAVVLIDEADVFLEKRETRDIKRNAMVAVFLRQLEYYAGILFLTTNRVEVFDEAMISRIHVTINYDKLSSTAKEHLWDAFLKKAEYAERLTPDQVKLLRELPLNGREIKNVVKVGTTLASHEKRAMVFQDLVRALKILNQAQFVQMSANEGT